MDVSQIVLIVGGLVLAYKFLLKGRVSGFIAKADAYLDNKVSKATPTGSTVPTSGKTVSLVQKWADARAAAVDAGRVEAVKSFDDSFKLLNAEGNSQ